MNFNYHWVLAGLWRVWAENGTEVKSSDGDSRKNSRFWLCWERRWDEQSPSCRAHVPVPEPRYVCAAGWSQLHSRSTVGSACRSSPGPGHGLVSNLPACKTRQKQCSSCFVILWNRLRCVNGGKWVVLCQLLFVQDCVYTCGGFFWEEDNPARKSPTDGWCWRLNKPEMARVGNGLRLSNVSDGFACEQFRMRFRETKSIGRSSAVHFFLRAFAGRNFGYKMLQAPTHNVFPLDSVA